MDKKQLDKVFVNIYEEIINSTTGMIVNMKKNMEPDAVVNECYITLVKNSAQLETERDVKRFLLKCIRDSVAWKKSKVSLQYNQRLNRDGKARNVYMSELEMERVAGAEDWEGFYDKLEGHKTDTSVKVTAEDYREQQSNEVILWYFNAYLAGKTCREIGEELNVHYVSAKRMTDKMKESVRSFAVERGVNINS